jgi:segregation and condensation protein B
LNTKQKQGKSFTMHRHPLRRPSPVLLQRPRALDHHRPPSLGFSGPNRKEAGGTAEGGDLVREPRLAQVEAALMAADEPLTLRRLIAAADLTDAAEGRRLIHRLRELYDRDGTAFQVIDVAGGYQLQTRPEFHPWLLRLRRDHTELRLSAAGRETLTIVAYRQPITRADIEGIRGVQCGEVLRQLMEKGLVRIGGRDDSLGRPVLYRTTKKFLQMFGLNKIEDLPLAEQMIEKEDPPAKQETEPTDDESEADSEG